MKSKINNEKNIFHAFENISDSYNKMNDITSLGMHRIWKLRVAVEISRRGNNKILDLCCGTGDMSFLLSRMNSKAEIVGIDFSKKMLETANKKKRNIRYDNIEFIEGNVRHIEFEDDTFDSVIISFGIKNVTDYEQVFREMERVVKPGGTIYCLDTFVPDGVRMRSLYKICTNFIKPVLGTVIARKGKDYRILNKSKDKLMNRAQISQTLKQCGFRDVGCYRHMFGIAACHRATK